MRLTPALEAVRWTSWSAETTTTSTSAGWPAMRRAISVSAVKRPPANTTSTGAPLMGSLLVVLGPVPSKTSTARAPWTAAKLARRSASQSRRAKISSFSAPRNSACRTL